MPRKSVAKKNTVIPEEENKNTNIFSFFRFNESYTSLILGIIVVIVASALLLSFVHNKNAGNVNTPINQQTQNTIEISQQAQDLAKRAPSGEIDGAVSTEAPTVTQIPTVTPIPTKSPEPTARPTIVVKPTITFVVKPTITLKPTVAPKPTIMHKTSKVIAKANPAQTNMPQVKTEKDNNVWVVQKGESLWSIAEKKYTSGYNWVDIARANNLSNPSDIHAGDRLVLPQVTPQVSTITVAVTKPTPSTVSKTQHVQEYISNNSNTITGNTYTVVRGDNLWNIAVRAYGDGYKWTQIAQVNNLANPRVIHSGNVLTIPR